MLELKLKMVEKELAASKKKSKKAKLRAKQAKEEAAKVFAENESILKKMQETNTQMANVQIPVVEEPEFTVSTPENME